MRHGGREDEVGAVVGAARPVSSGGCGKDGSGSVKASVAPGGKEAMGGGGS